MASSVHWVYRGWLWLCSAQYRTVVREEYARMSIFGSVFDLLFSTLFFIAELAALIYVFAL
ncbi:hypothetical protein GCM10025776_17280 [Corallincola platygyrae]